MYLFTRRDLKWLILISQREKIVVNLANGPAQKQNPGWLDIHDEATEVITLTDVGAAETCRRDTLLRKAARVARPNTGTITIDELGGYRPVDDYPPGRPVGPDDDTALGGRSACESELGFFNNSRSPYADDAAARNAPHSTEAVTIVCPWHRALMVETTHTPLPLAPYPLSLTPFP